METIFNNVGNDCEISVKTEFQLTVILSDSELYC